jgi:hypothetical protein
MIEHHSLCAKQLLVEYLNSSFFKRMNLSVLQVVTILSGRFIPHLHPRLGNSAFSGAHGFSKGQS